MADDFLTLPLDKAVGALKYVLQPARIVHRKPRTHQSEQHDQKHKYQELHRHGVRNWRLRVFGMNAERLQQSRHRAREESVQYLSNPKLFRHSPSVSLPAVSYQLATTRTRSQWKCQIPRTTAVQAS